MSPSWTLAAAAVTGLVAVVELVRRRRLREEFSWLWLLAFAVLLGLALLPVARLRLQAWMAARGDLGAVAAVAVVFLTALCLDFSIQVSRFATQQKNLAQEMALLRQRLDERDPGRRNDG